jgi:hypothetical protein
MKLSRTKKKTASSALTKQHVLDPRQLSEQLGSVPLEIEDENPQEIATDSDVAFLIMLAQMGGLQRKDFQFGMRVSKELVKLWFEGQRRNPLKSARDCVALFPTRLIPTILEYIAGSNFDGGVLTAEQQQARMLAKMP